MLEQEKFPTVDAIEKAFANPIKYDFDYCLKEYTARVNKYMAGHQSISQLPSSIYDFIDKEKIVEMPGIDYEKIKLYRMAKKKKKFTSMDNICDHPKQGSSLNFNQREEFKTNKQRYKSI